MSAARQRLSARDYKHGGRRGGSFGLAQYRQFGIGLGVGLLVALVVWVQGRRAVPAEEVIAAAPPPTAPEVAPAEEPPETMEFYELLPSFEVHVPDVAQRSGRPTQPLAPITRPGLYVIQAGSWRNPAPAEAERARLAKFGIKANVQSAVVDGADWHRVIIGPTRDLAFLNSTRQALQEAKATFSTYPLGE